MDFRKAHFDTCDLLAGLYTMVLVMNTKTEVQQAFEDYKQGNFHRQTNKACGNSRSMRFPEFTSRALRYGTHQEIPVP